MIKRVSEEKRIFVMLEKYEVFQFCIFYCFY